MIIIKRLSMLALVVLLALSLAGCTPGLTIGYNPDELDVFVNKADVYSSRLQMTFNGFGFLYIKDMVARLEITGENFDEEDIAEYIEEIAEFEYIGAKTWERVETIDDVIPVIFNLFGTILDVLDEEDGIVFEVDSSSWQDDPELQEKILEMEKAILTLSFTDLEGETITSAKLTINFLEALD